MRFEMIRCDGCKRRVDSLSDLTIFRPDGMEDSFGLCNCCVSGVQASERARCVKIFADLATMLESAADQYPAGTAVCFAAEARECERRIRGKK